MNTLNQHPVASNPPRAHRHRRRWSTSLYACRLLLIALLGGAANQLAGADTPPAMVPGHLIVVFKPDAAEAEKDDLENSLGDETLNTFAGIKGRLIKIGSQRPVDQAISEYQANSHVLFAEPDYIVHAVVAPNDALFGSLWALNNTGLNGGTPGADIKAESAWNITTGSAKVVVGIVDSGLDYMHPDLAANVWVNPGGINNGPAGSHGFNAIAQTFDPLDDNGHGTHVAGIIGAVGNNAIGVVGVNWSVSLMGLKFLDAQGAGAVSDAIAAIDFAVRAKQAGVNLRVLNNSWGGNQPSVALLNEINLAAANDILFVVAAGNDGADIDGLPAYPPDYRTANMVVVAATDRNDLLAKFSNYGVSRVDLGAPGVAILSTYPGSQYMMFDGTSMATPQVSGAAALILSLGNQSVANLKAAILNNVDPVPSLAGKTVTGGRLNLFKALPTGPDFALSLAPGSQTVTAGSNATYSVTVTGLGGFNGAVTLSASGLPGGAGASFNPASVTGSGGSTLTITTSASALAGSFTLTVTGTSGSLQHTATATLAVQPAAAPDFALAITPASRMVTAGSSGAYSVTVSSSGGFNGTVSLSAAGLPAGAIGSFNPASVSGSGGSTLTITTSASTPAGSYSLTVTGASGSLLHTATATLVVQAAATPDFALSITPASRTVTAGSNAAYTVSINASGGFSGIVTLSVAGLPAGAIGSFNPASVSGSGGSALTITTSASTPAGSYPLAVTGASGSLQHTATANLVVQAPATPDFALSIVPAFRRVTAGSSAAYNVMVNASGGFSGTVAMSAAGLPTGAIASFNPASISGSGGSALTITTSASTPAGSYAFTVTGASGSLQHAATATLVVSSNTVPANFILVVRPTIRMISPGAQTRYLVVVRTSEDFNGTVQFKIADLPEGVMAHFNPTSISASGYTILTVNTSANTAAGRYALKVTATSGNQSRVAAANLVVAAEQEPGEDD